MSDSSSFVIVADNGESYSDHSHACFMTCETLTEAEWAVGFLREWHGKRPKYPAQDGPWPPRSTPAYAAVEQKCKDYYAAVEVWKTTWPLLPSISLPPDGENEKSEFSWIEVPAWAKGRP